jgi:daunorubicin resistance ABC transporter membrane protein
VSVEAATVAQPEAGVAYDLATIRVLWKRDLVRFFRQKSRVIGALVQPLIFWAVIGSGFAPSFKVAGAEGVGYLQYFYPGIILMVILFTSIFSTMSLIEDRHEGFLQAVLAAPGSRMAVVLGKVLGGASLAAIQAIAIIALAPLAGFPLASIAWPMLIAMLLLTSIALSAVGFAVAWWLDSVQGYHAVMSVLLLPAWIVSGSMFPMTNGPRWMHALMAVNPLTYAASGVRRALGGGALAHAIDNGSGSAAVELAVVTGVSVLAIALATLACAKRSPKG